MAETRSTRPPPHSGDRGARSNVRGGSMTGDVQMAWTEGMILGKQTRLISEPQRRDGRRVWLAHDDDEAREVLVEVARSSWRRDASALFGFHAAAEAAVALRHPSLLRVFSHGLDGERLPFVVREVPPEATVATEVAAQGSLGLRVVARMVEQLLRVLDLVHEDGLGAGGVTPDLVYLAGPDRDQVKLWLELVSTGPTRTARDLCCASPERLRDGDELVDRRASLWEVGALAYYALSGKAPFVALNAALLHEVVRAGRFQRIALRGEGGEASRIELDGWFRKALAFAPEKRFASAREMLDAWQSVAGGLLLFVDRTDVGAVTLVPPTNDEDRVALRPSKPPPPTSSPADDPLAFDDTEEVTRIAAGRELLSLLDDEGEDDTVISVRPSVPLSEMHPATERSSVPEPAPSGHRVAERRANAAATAGPREPSEPTEPAEPLVRSERPTEFPLTTSVRPQAASRSFGPLMLALGVLVAATSSVATTWLSRPAAPECDCSAVSAAAPCDGANPETAAVTPKVPAAAATSDDHATPRGASSGVGAAGSALAPEAPDAQVPPSGAVSAAGLPSATPVSAEGRATPAPATTTIWPSPTAPPRDRPNTEQPSVEVSPAPPAPAPAAPSDDDPYAGG